jgi:hypothetical protein
MSHPPLPPDELHLLYILLDSNLPTGGFVSSSGLESYVKHGFLGLPSNPSPYAEASTLNTTPFTAVRGTKDVIRGVTDFAEAEVGHYANTTGCFVKEAWEIMDRTLRNLSNTSDEMDVEKVLQEITALDVYHESTLLSHVARRASKAQGVAMLTLFGRGLTRPVGFELDLGTDINCAEHEDGRQKDKSSLDQEKEKRSMAIIDGYKRLVRKGAVPGHLAVCWGVITASLGLALGKSSSPSFVPFGDSTPVLIHGRTLAASVPVPSCAFTPLDRSPDEHHRTLRLFSNAPTSIQEDHRARSRFTQQRVKYDWPVHTTRRCQSAGEESGILGLDERSRSGTSDDLAFGGTIDGTTRYAAFTDIQFIDKSTKQDRVRLYTYSIDHRRRHVTVYVFEHVRGRQSKRLR